MTRSAFGLMELAEALQPVTRLVKVDADAHYRLLGVRWYGNGCRLHSATYGRELKTRQLNRVEQGDVVYNKMWVRKSAFAVVDSAHAGLVATAEYPTFVANTDRLDPAFFRFLSVSNDFVERAAAACKGSTSRARLNPADFLRLRVRLPPIAEQRKIAAILSSVDEVIEKTEAVIEQLQGVKKAMMQELLTRGLPGRHTRFKKTEIGEIPEEWTVVKLLDVAALPSGQVDPREDPYRHQVLIAPNHIESATGQLLSTETAEGQNAVSGKYRFEAGDVVYSKIRPYLSKAWLATFDGICSADMYPLRPTARLQPGYLLAILLSTSFTDFAKSVSARTGIPKINREELGEYSVGLPAQDEQVKIEAALASVDARTKAESALLKQQLVVKSTLMSVLLTGELRVTPDEAAV